MPWDFWLIFIALGVLVPWRGRSRMAHLLALKEFRSSDRLFLYLATIVFQWTLAGIVAWRALARGLSLCDLGLCFSDAARMAGWAVAGSVVFGVLQWMNLRRMGRLPAEKRGILQPLAERIFPLRAAEAPPFLLLALTAGICEEFLYRGFALAALTRAGVPGWFAVFASAVLFGLAHLYQGRGGFVATSLLGVIFGFVRLAYTSLLPPVVWHFAVDAVAGFAAPYYLVRQGRSDKPVETGVTGTS